MPAVLILYKMTEDIRTDLKFRHNIALNILGGRVMPKPLITPQREILYIKRRLMFIMVLNRTLSKFGSHILVLQY